jgi:16S rRNA (guanine1207-N2)-methyltransferase
VERCYSGAVRSLNDTNSLTLSTGINTLELRRFPHREKDNLRAWDAADEYILNELAGRGLLQATSRILLLNDQFGALAVSLS